MQNWNPWKIKLYLCLICWANDEPSQWKDYTIKRGQLLRSLNTIRGGVAYHIQYTSDPNRVKTPSKTTVKRIIDTLKMERLIDYKVVPHGYIISINYYDTLCTTPFLKMVRKFDDKVERLKLTKREVRELQTRLPKWMYDEGLA